MIIEVDDKTGLATTYKSVMEFARNHKEELEDRYKKRFTPEIQVEVNNIQLLQDLLPEGTSPIKKIHEHRNYIVVNCENGEIHSLDRSGEYPYFKFYK